MKAADVLAYFVAQYCIIETLIYNYICDLKDVNDATAVADAYEAACKAAKAAKTQRPDDKHLWTRELCPTYNGPQWRVVSKRQYFSSKCYKTQTELLKLLKRIRKEALSYSNIAMNARNSIYRAAFLIDYLWNLERIKDNADIAIKELALAKIAYKKAHQEFVNVCNLHDCFSQSDPNGTAHCHSSAAINDKDYARGHRAFVWEAFSFAEEFAHYTTTGVAIVSGLKSVESYV